MLGERWLPTLSSWVLPPSHWSAVPWFLSLYCGRLQRENYLPPMTHTLGLKVVWMWTLWDVAPPWKSHGRLFSTATIMPGCLWQCHQLEAASTATDSNTFSGGLVPSTADTVTSFLTFSFISFPRASILWYLFCLPRPSPSQPLRTCLFSV